MSYLCCGFDTKLCFHDGAPTTEETNQTTFDQSRNIFLQPLESIQLYVLCSTPANLLSRHCQFECSESRHSFLRTHPRGDADELEQLVTLSGAVVAWLHPSGFFLDQMPLGWDVVGDTYGKTSSPRIALSGIGPGEGG